MPTETSPVTIIAPGLWTPPETMYKFVNHHGVNMVFDPTNYFTRAENLFYLGQALMSEIELKFAGRQVHLIGHSMCGLVAQMVVEQMPLVRATLIAPAPPNNILLGGLALNARMLGNGILRGRLFRHRVIPTPGDMTSLMANRVTPTIRQHYDLLNAKGYPRKWVWDIILKRCKVKPLGRRVRILSGRADKMITWGTCRKTADFHGCEMRVHIGGHLPWIESHHEVAMIQTILDLSWGFDQ